MNSLYELTVVYLHRTRVVKYTQMKIECMKIDKIGRPESI